MAEPITWANEQRKLGELIPWERNPREINTKEAQRLGDSLVQFGQIQTIAIDEAGNILDGHQRKAVWSLLPQFGVDHVVDVRVSSRALSEQERQKLVVYLHRGTVGNFDWDMLANNFEVPDLLKWGFEESELQLDWGSAEDYKDLDAELDKLEGYEEVDVNITVPAMYKAEVMDWLANGESLTAPGMGKGVLKRCGLL